METRTRECFLFFPECSITYILKTISTSTYLSCSIKTLPKKNRSYNATCKILEGVPTHYTERCFCTCDTRVTVNILLHPEGI